MDIALLVLRVVFGLLMVGHGAQKLFGLFGGHGLEGTAGWLAGLNLKPPKLWALAGGLSEFGGGLLLAFGLLTPLAALALIGAMLIATVLVHFDKGLWASNGGYELPVTIAAAAATVLIAGPGRYSVDAFLGISLPPLLILAGALGIAAAAAVAISGRPPFRGSTSEA